MKRWALVTVLLYALILILVAIVVVAALGLVGVDVLRLYTDVTDVITTVFTQ